MARRKQQPARRKPSARAPAPIASGPEQSHLYERGQTVVPKKIRDAMGLEEGATLVWNIHDGVAHVIALPRDPIRGAFGILKGKGLTMEQFLAERNAERQRERELEADEERRWRTYSTRPPR